jgi:hypothetical protein
MNDPTFNTGSGNMGTNSGANSGANMPDINVASASVVTPTDRVRWGPIIAGLFSALSLLALLSVLGAAVGLTAYDQGDNARNFGIGAGIWGAISMILAFFFGGWLAARSAAVRGERNGLLNGSLVWAVAIPLLIYVLAGGVARMADTAANVADAAQQNQSGQDQVDRVIRASTGNREDANQNTTNTQTQNTNQNQSQANQNQNQNQNQNRQEEARKAASRTAWGTLVSMLLGLIAAAVGGYTGSRDRNIFDRNDRRFMGGGQGGYQQPAGTHPQQQQGGSRTYGSNP